MQDDFDRRVRRTRRALATALIELGTERPYPSIQVRDITDRADVGYATFYRHYDSKDELMLAVFDQITAELETSATGQNGEYFKQEGRLVFGHVQMYEGLYRNILQSHPFIQQLKKLLARRIEEHLRLHTQELRDPPFPMDLASHHMVVSLVGLIEWWLDNGKKLPVAEMARIYERLIIQATWYAIRSGDTPSSQEHE